MHPSLIDAAALRALDEPVAVFDCRFSLADAEHGRRAYLAGHLPGARHLDMEKDLSGPRTAGRGRHPLPARGALEGTLRRAGVCAGMPVVVYDAQRLAGAARAWWLLRHFGLRDVRVLDGGFEAWRAAGAPTVSGPEPDVPAGDVRLSDVGIDVVDAAAVLALLDGPPGTLVDAREPARFAGREEPIDPVAGRIPGARNLPWTAITDERGRVRPIKALRQLWSAATPSDDPVAYCGSGVTASVLLLSRAIAGLPGGRLYAGSWSEWCADPARPVERDA